MTAYTELSIRVFDARVTPKDLEQRIRKVLEKMSILRDVARDWEIVVAAHTGECGPETCGQAAGTHD